MPRSVPVKASAKRRVNPLVQFDDEAIVSEVGMTFARSARFWSAVESTTPARAAAAELVPCERGAHLCVVSYVGLARDALSAAAGRPKDIARSAAHMRVIQYDKRLAWGVDGQPLTTRTRHARFPQFDRPLLTLERILEHRCAEPGCGLPPSSDAKAQRRRLSRRVCCLRHEVPQRPHETAPGDFYRRQVGKLLTDVWATIDRAEKQGSQALPLPSGLPVGR